MESDPLKQWFVSTNLTQFTFSKIQDPKSWDCGCALSIERQGSKLVSLEMDLSQFDITINTGRLVAKPRQP